MIEANIAKAPNDPSKNISLEHWLTNHVSGWSDEPLKDISSSIMDYFKDFAPPLKSLDPDATRFEGNSRLRHNMWMLSEIVNNTSMSVTARHRWFGFVQADLVQYGWITIVAFRDITRHVFNGD